MKTLTAKSLTANTRINAIVWKNPDKDAEYNIVVSGDMNTTFGVFATLTAANGSVDMTPMMNETFVPGTITMSGNHQLQLFHSSSNPGNSFVEIQS